MKTVIAVLLAAVLGFAGGYFYLSRKHAEKAAFAGADESTFYTTNVNPAFIREGTNLIAVEIHQQSTTSSDVSFNLYLTARAFGRPDLTVAREDDQLLLSWPTAPDRFTLEYSATADGIWTPVAESPIVRQGLNTLLVTLTPENRFYRLARH